MIHDVIRNNSIALEYVTTGENKQIAVMRERSPCRRMALTLAISSAVPEWTRWSNITVPIAIQ
jgi:hypothetical protein